MPVTSEMEECTIYICKIKPRIGLFGLACFQSTTALGATQVTSELAFFFQMDQVVKALNFF